MSLSTPVTVRSLSPVLSRAGQWHLLSGIQEAEGGVARYHYISENRNARVSTEITGYTVSALLELYDRSCEDSYLEAAARGGDLLVKAWDGRSSAMPFEWSASGVLPEHHSYFFDNGIIARALLRLWRATGSQQYLDMAVCCGESMSRDFVNRHDIHPILTLPGKCPVARDARWSRSSDCYQLKSALAWLDLYEVTGNESFRSEFEWTLERALQTHGEFFDHEPQNHRIMDRLHAYGYFLEAILAVSERPEVRQALEEGIEREAAHLRAVRHEFERSDANAQLLRVRLWADAQGAVALNQEAAAQEARWAAAYQMESEDPRLDGGFNFGRREGVLSNYSNPVSTAFCLQALALWDDYQQGLPLADRRSLI
ncbi:hypothetical protein [Paludibaculum fermentans]|uniref:hypothetical protein n=1 Tax=Paludibaculum fermentans TaxID=1473598 RepID=UPI003EBF552B